MIIIYYASNRYQPTEIKIFWHDDQSGFNYIYIHMDNDNKIIPQLISNKIMDNIDMRHKKEIAHCIEGISGKNSRLTYIFFIQYLHFTVRYYTENRIN
jgi:hypothetical protein